jgi:hypothetical protein
MGLTRRTCARRLDPPTLAANMRTGIYQSMRRVLDETAMAECEGVWTATPQHVKEEILEVAMERSTCVTLSCAAPALTLEPGALCVGRRRLCLYFRRE